jgi:hypothetical protein
MGFSGIYGSPLESSWHTATWTVPPSTRSADYARLVSLVAGDKTSCNCLREAGANKHADRYGEPVPRITRHFIWVVLYINVHIQKQGYAICLPCIDRV